MWREQTTQRDYGAVHVHLSKLEIWPQESHHWVGSSNHQRYQDVLEGWPWCGTVREDSEKWVWRGVQVYSVDCKGDSDCSSEGFVQREVPKQTRVDSQQHGWLSSDRQDVCWKLAVAQNHREDVWRRGLQGTGTSTGSEDLVTDGTSTSEWKAESIWK